MRHLRLLVIALALWGLYPLHVHAQQAERKARAARANAVGTASPRISGPEVLPGTRSDVFSSIQGTALDSVNRSLRDAPVRLRDARLGWIVDRQVTDKSGLFFFRPVDPGIYIIELTGPDQTVLAASEMLSANAGQTVSAVVKLPFRVGVLSELLGPSATLAAVVMAAGAAAGVSPVKATTSRTP